MDYHRNPCSSSSCCVLFVKRIAFRGTLMLPRTQVAIVEATATPQLSSGIKPNTPLPTETLKPTSAPTFTRILATLTPTVRPTPAFVAQTQKLGPIRETERDEQYTVQVAVTDVRYPEPDMFSHPKSGMVYIVVSVVVQNSGPGTIHSLYTSDFQVKDASGALRGDSMLAPGTRDCGLDLVDLSSGGSISGCIGFEVPASGRLKGVAQALKKANWGDIATLRDWEEAYEKECFYNGIRILFELERDGKSNR
jgi:hypothetical protein